MRDSVNTLDVRRTLRYVSVLESRLHTTKLGGSTRCRSIDMSARTAGMSSDIYIWNPTRTQFPARSVRARTFNVCCLVSPCSSKEAVSTRPIEPASGRKRAPPATARRALPRIAMAQVLTPRALQTPQRHPTTRSPRRFRIPRRLPSAPSSVIMTYPGSHEVDSCLSKPRPRAYARPSRR